jgi:hypothetical protein
MIRENLERTPEERVELGAAFTDSLLEIRRSSRKLAA